MPTRRKTIEELKKSGTYAKHKGRYRSRLLAEQGGEPLGDPPAWFTPKEAAVWKEIECEAPEGALKKDCRKLVELTTLLVIRQRLDPEPALATLERGLRLIGKSPDDDITELVDGLRKELTPSIGEQRVLLSCLSSMGMAGATSRTFLR